MPTCLTCGKRLCEQSRQYGSTELGCPMKGGSIWVHVLDDLGNNLNGVEVNVPDSTKPTQAGVATFEPLNADKYTVSIKSVPSRIAQEYDAPASLEEENVPVYDREITYVAFEYKRKAQLKVKVVKKGEPARVFADALVEVKGAKSGPETRATAGSGQDVFANFGWQSAGTYPIGLTLQGQLAKEYQRVQTNLQVQLSPGDDEIVNLEIEALPKLKVKVFSKDPAYLCKDAVVKIGNGYPDTNTVDGIADFGPVKEGRYQLDVDLSDDDAKKYDFILDFEKSQPQILLKADDDITVEVEVQPMYDKIRFIAHCLVTVPKMVYQHAKDETPEGFKDTRERWADCYRDFFYKQDQVDIEDARKNKRFDLKQDEKYKEVELKLQKTTIKKEDEEKYIDDIILEENSSVIARLVGNKQVPIGGTWKMQYNGVDGSEKENVEALAAFVKASIEEAANQIGADKKDELKVYLLPEAVFLGHKGAYEVENVSLLLEELQKVVMDGKWKHWVFALGTANGVYIGEDGKVSTMFNMAPILRGGCGDASKAPDYSWLVRKATFCQEIPGASDLIGDGHTEDEVGFQFGATENEYKLGVAIRKLLDTDVKIAGDSIRDLFKKEGLRKSHWDHLKTVVTSQVNDRGLYAAVREIRKCQRGGIDATPLSALQFWATQISARVDEYGKPRDISDIAEGWQSVARLMMLSYLPAPATWKAKPKTDKIAALNKVLEECRGTRLPTPKPITVRKIQYQRKTLEEKIGEVLVQLDGDDNTLFNAIVDAKPKATRFNDDFWDFDWVFSFKKILVLHLRETGQEDILKEKVAESYKFEDFTFSCKRIPGPWLPDESKEAKKTKPDPPELLLWESAGPWSKDDNRAGGSKSGGAKKPVKKITFGLEICADHSELRLAKSLKSWSDSNPTLTAPPIHVQLIPSAGMTIAHDKIVARKDGHVFNCDGWMARGAGTLKKMTDRGAMVLQVVNDGAPDDPGHNPLSPHSELCKSSGPGAAATTITVEKPAVKLNLAEGKIFASGAGELHIYPSQPLVFD